MIPDDIRKTWGVFKFYSVAIIVLCVVAYSAFLLGNKHYAKQQFQIDSQQHTIDNLSLENNQLTSKVNVMGVEVEIQRLAAQRAQNVIEQGLERESELKQQLLFYQKVMAPELKQEGFLIESVEVKPTGSEGVFWLEIILMQQETLKNTINGTLQIQLLGSQSDTQVSLPVSDMLVDSKQAITFGFKYFQIIERQIKLPKDFVPEQIVVNAEIFQFKRKRGELNSSFEWPEDDLNNALSESL